MLLRLLGNVPRCASRKSPKTQSYSTLANDSGATQLSGPGARSPRDKSLNIQVDV